MMSLFGNTLSSSNHDSPVGMLGSKGQQWTDPIAWLPGGLGKKWVNLTSNEIPKMTNEVLSPVAQLGGQVDKTINPFRKIPAVNNIMSTVEAKPADAIGTAVGAYFAAPALAGAMGGGGAGGAAGAGEAGAGTGAITAAPGVSMAGSGTALGSTAGMSGTWGSVAGGAGGMNPMMRAMLQQQMSGKGMFGNQGGGQPQQQQLSAANGSAPQATISAAPQVPTVNPALRQQIMAQMMMRGY